MTLVNFYRMAPSDTQVVSNLSDDDLVVFNHLTSGARELAERVEVLVDFDFQMLNENTIPRWAGADYFVMVNNSFDYFAVREKLRAIAVAWVDAGCPDQIKHI